MGAKVAVSGPGRGYIADPQAAAFLLLGDESAIPAICQLLESLPAVPIVAGIEITEPAARMKLNRATDEHWHHQVKGAVPGEALVQAVESAALPEGVRVWAAGEAAPMQRIRKHLVGAGDLPRHQTHIRGYWKAGR